MTTSRNRRRVLIALICGFSFTHAATDTVNATDANLVSTVVQDCCEPTPPITPICPPVGEYYLTPSSPPEESSAEASETDADDTDDDAPAEPVAQSDDFPTASAFAAGATASTVAASSANSGQLNAPNMLGDFFGAGFGGFAIIGYPPLSNPAISNRRFKYTENISPLPQDRVFFSYNYFDDAGGFDTVNSVDLSRYHFGGEKTFADEMFSVEFRIMVNDGYDATQTDAANGPQEGATFGNLMIGLKSLLYQTDRLQIGGGLLMALPTAEDTEIEGEVTIENDAVYIGPYLGFLAQDDSPFFLQGVLQTEFVTVGDRVVNNDGSLAGRFNEQNFLYASLSGGAWLYTNTCRSACINGVAALAELHYSSSLNDGDFVEFTGGTGAGALAADTLLARGANFDILNATFGFAIQTGMTNIRVGGGFPLRDGTDEAFDSEFLLQINRFF